MSLRSEVIRILNEYLSNAKKITELTGATTPLSGSEYVEIVQGGVSKKVAAGAFAGGSFDLSGMVRRIGDFSLAGNVFPSTGGSGPAGAVAQGNSWYITNASTSLTDEAGNTIPAGVIIEAKIDNPANNDAADWYITYTVI